MSPKKHNRRVAVFVRRKCSEQLSAGQGLTAWLWGRGGKEPGKARNRWKKPTLHRAWGVSAQRVAAGALPPVGDFFPVLQSTRSEGRGRRWLLPTGLVLGHRLSQRLMTPTALAGTQSQPPRGRWRESRGRFWYVRTSMFPLC